jgi:hypothetical protein
MGEVFKVGGIHYCCHSSDFVIISGVDPTHQPFSPTVEIPSHETVKVQAISDAFYVDSLKQGLTLPDWLSVISPANPVRSTRHQKLVSIPSIVIAPWVTSILGFAFHGGRTLTFSPNSQLKEIDGFSRGKFRSITIPDSVRSISTNGFYECKALKTIEFGPNPQIEVINGFSHCYGLTSVSIPNSVVKIDSNAFQECSSLTSVLFASNPSLTQISGFSKCGFVAFSVPSYIEVLDLAFDQCYSLGCLEFAPGSRLRLIKGFGKTRIGILKLPETIEIIGPGAFSGCAELSTVIITGPNVLTSFCGFKNCSKLLSVIIGSQEWIRDGVWDFSVCPVLREINGFDKCCLKAIVFPDNIEIIRGFIQCRDLVRVEFPRSGTLKVVEGFSETAIKKLEFPSSVEMIAGFVNCQMLETVEFAADGCLRTIKGFRYAECLTEVIIPVSVKSLGWESFSLCDQLSKVLLPLDGKICELNGFSGIPITSIIIPDSVEFLQGLCRCSNLK